jgi:hypothetical protein
MRELFSYNTRSTIVANADGSKELTIHYDEGLNAHIECDPQWRHTLWGTSTITLDPALPANLRFGNAHWQGKYYHDLDGDARWRRISAGLHRRSRRLVTATHLQRAQAKLRVALLSDDPCCTLTGERTADALEAAHIIPASDGGREVINNAILLRADLHRLYDAGRFAIDPSGCVVIRNDAGEGGYTRQRAQP